MPMTFKTKALCKNIMHVMRKHPGKWLTSKYVFEHMWSENARYYTRNTIATLLGTLTKQGVLEVKRTTPKQYMFVETEEE